MYFPFVGGGRTILLPPFLSAPKTQTLFFFYFSPGFFFRIVSTQLAPLLCFSYFEKPMNVEFIGRQPEREVKTDPLLGRFSRACMGKQKSFFLAVEKFQK